MNPSPLDYIKCALYLALYLAPLPLFCYVLIHFIVKYW